MALVDLGAALVAGALWYVRPELGPLPLLLLAIGLVVRHFSDPPVEYELTALDAAVALFLVSAGIGLLIAYDWNVALEKFYVILGGVGIYGALVRVPEKIELGGWPVKPINLLLGVLPTAIAAYYVVTADYSLQIGKLPLLDGVFEWISSWQPSLPGHKLHPNVAGGLIAALLPLQVLALAALRLHSVPLRVTGAASAMTRAPYTPGQPQGSPLPSGGSEGGGAGVPGILSGATEGRVVEGRLGWRWPGIETVLVLLSLLGLVLSASRGAWAALMLVTAIWALVSRIWPSRVGPAGGKTTPGVTGLVVVLVLAGLVAAPGASFGSGLAPSAQDAQFVRGFAQDAEPLRGLGVVSREPGSTLSGTEPAGGVQSKGAGLVAHAASFGSGLAPSAQDAQFVRGFAQDAQFLRGFAQDAQLVRGFTQDAQFMRGFTQDAQFARGGASFDYAPSGRSAQDALAQDVEPLRGLGVVDGRATLLRDSLALAWDTAFTGIGLGGFQMAFSSYILLLHVGHTFHSHNLFLNVWLEQGLLGLLALVWLLGAAVVAWRRVRRLGDAQGKAWAAAALAAIAVIAVHGMVDDAFYGSRGVLLLFVPFALLTRAQGDAVWSAYEPPTLTQVLVSKNGLIAAAVLAFALLVGLTPPVRSQFQANLGSLSQTQAELSVYEWPTWPIQDALRRAPGSAPADSGAGGAKNEPGASAQNSSGGTTPDSGAALLSDARAAVDLGPAIGHYEAALAIDPKNEVANRRLGQIALSRGDYPAAGVLLTAAYYNDYTNRAARQLYGEWLAIEGRTEEAARVWRTVDVSAGQLDARVWWYESIGEMGKADAVRGAAEIEK